MSSKPLKLLMTTLLAIYISLLSNSAMAFLLFDNKPKWGDPGPGTGTIVTWSLIPDGTDVLRSADLPNLPQGTNEFLFQDFWSGPSQLTGIYSQLDSDPGVGASLFHTALAKAFATWSAAADINFVEVTDSGLPLAHPDALGSQAGDIRIGAFPLSNPFDCCAAFGFEPPGGTNFRSSYNPTTTGDISLNSLAFFSAYTGLNEGDAIDGFPNDIEGLLIHEIGHALGLAHPEDDGLSSGEELAIMFVGNGCCDRIQRTLGADDINGIQALYGVRAVPIPTAAWLFAPAFTGLGILTGRRRRGIA